MLSNVPRNGVLFRCTFDGTNGSTTFTDTGQFGYTLTGTGSPSLSNAQAPHTATTSLALSGSQYVATAGSTQSTGWLDLDNMDFAIEFKVYRTGAFSADHAVVSRWTPAASTRRFWLGFNSAGNVKFVFFTGSSTETTILSTATVGTGAWVTIRMVKMGTLVALFIDNTLDSLHATATSFASADPALALTIGAMSNGTSVMVASYLADVIITGNPAWGNLVETSSAGLALPAVPSAYEGDTRSDTFNVDYIAGYARQYSDFSSGPPVDDASNFQTILFTIIQGQANAGNQDPATAEYTGTVYNNGLPAVRTIKAYRRDNGYFVSETSSDVTGEFTIMLVPNIEHFVICFDDEDAPVKNDLIKRKTVIVP